MVSSHLLPPCHHDSSVLLSPCTIDNLSLIIVPHISSYFHDDVFVRSAVEDQYRSNNTTTESVECNLNTCIANIDEGSSASVMVPYGVAVVSNRPRIQTLRDYMQVIEPLITNQSIDDIDCMNNIQRVIRMEEVSQQHELVNRRHRCRSQDDSDINNRMVFEALSPYNLVAVIFACLVSNTTM